MERLVLAGRADIRSSAAWRGQLSAALERGDAEIAIAPDAEPDLAALQLVVAAICSARAAGRALGVAMDAGSPAGLLWSRLALDALPETRLTDPSP